MVEDAGVPVEQLHAAARRPEVVSAMEAFYLRADALVAARPGTCWNRAQCCRFGEYGHRLYVTALEVAYYLARRTEAPSPHGDICAHARDGRCHARVERPLGCRIFFCDPLAADWQGPLTETLLGELRAMHATLDVPYFYADWMAVQRQLACHLPQARGADRAAQPVPGRHGSNPTVPLAVLRSEKLTASSPRSESGNIQKPRDSHDETVEYPCKND